MTGAVGCVGPVRAAVGDDDDGVRVALGRALDAGRHVGAAAARQGSAQIVDVGDLDRFGGGAVAADGLDAAEHLDGLEHDAYGLADVAVAHAAGRVGDDAHARFGAA